MMRLASQARSVVPRFRRAYVVRATITEPLPADSPLRQGRLRIGFSADEGTARYNETIRSSILFGASQPQLWAPAKADLLKSATTEDKQLVEMIEKAVNYQKYAFAHIPSPQEFEAKIRAEDEKAIADYQQQDEQFAEALRTAF